jgi:threonine aldolase
VAGSAEFIARARRFRKMFGGTMRQAGVLAAAAEYALDHHVDRLAEDHTNAQRLADCLADCRGLTMVPPETNILYFDVDPALGEARLLAESATEQGVWILAVAPQRIRAVTHLEIGAADIDRAGSVIRSVAATLA